MTMGFFRNTNRKHSHIDPATGRNKRDNTRREHKASPRRQNGRIVSRAASARKQRTERALRRRGRR
jgi:hypothetical protein